MYIQKENSMQGGCYSTLHASYIQVTDTLRHIEDQRIETREDRPDLSEMRFVI